MGILTASRTSSGGSLSKICIHNFALLYTFIYLSLHHTCCAHTFPSPLSIYLIGMLRASSHSPQFLYDLVGANTVHPLQEVLIRIRSAHSATLRVSLLSSLGGMGRGSKENMVHVHLFIVKEKCAPKPNQARPDYTTPSRLLDRFIQVDTSLAHRTLFSDLASLPPSLALLLLLLYFFLGCWRSGFFCPILLSARSLESLIHLISSLTPSRTRPRTGCRRRPEAEQQQQQQR